MKKKKVILFICSNMNIGGFQKSLINLLINFDYKRYNVDLLLINQCGVFINDIPKEVNVINLNNLSSSFFYSTKKSIKALIKGHKFILVICRIFISLVALFDKGYGAMLMSKFIPKIDKEYDCCIDYNGQYLNYYMINKINAKKKITYFHSDYSKWDYYKKADRKYYKKVDAIVTVSDICVESLKKYFPEYSDKIYCVENIITRKTVSPNCKLKHKLLNIDKFKIVTVGRVCIDKGYDLALEAAKLLEQDKYDFEWYWIGPGNNSKEVIELKNKYNIDNIFKFLGPSADPYYYIEKADIVVFPSKFEGKSVVIEETKIINKPIVVTNFSTVDNQIKDLKSGIIVEMSGQAIYEGIKKLLEDKKLCKSIINYQQNNCKGNLNEINKIYKLIEINQLKV